jgi:hypothetical protein
MTGEEIAREMKTTRQYVSQTLKSGMKKVYCGIARTKPHYTPYEIALEMLLMFDVSTHDAPAFFNLFPPKYREKIKKDATKRFPGVARRGK